MTAPLLLTNTAKEILAAAVLELFPGTKLLGGEASSVDFYYDFHVPSQLLKTLDERELSRIEEQMGRIIHEKRPIKALEMLRENASDYLRHLGQEGRAEEAKMQPVPTVSLFEMGPFRDLCREPFIKNSAEIGAIKLLASEATERGVRITGTAREDKQSLKDFLKRYREAKKSDYRLRGPKLSLFDRFPEVLGEEWVFLPNGEALKQSLIAQWRQMHLEMEFQFTSTKASCSLEELHRLVHAKTGVKRLASLCEEEADLASIFCSERELLPELISSLQFIERTVKIFGFIKRIYLVQPRKETNKNFTLLKTALERVGFPYEEVEGEDQELISFHLLDAYGREWKGPYLTVNGAQGVIHRALFGSVQRWVFLVVELMKA